ncbi:RCC1 and BTB domain-containing protein 1, partial [Massospora cicadina]
MASNLPPTKELNPSDGTQEANITPSSEKEAAQKPWEKDLASLVATHSSQFFLQPPGATSATPPNLVGNNASASSRFNMAPAHPEANKEAAKPAFPVAAATWAPPTFGSTATPPKPSWTPPASATNVQPAVGSAGTDVPEVALGWSPPKFVAEQQSQTAETPSLLSTLGSTVASQPSHIVPKPQISDSCFETNVASTTLSTQESAEPPTSFASELKSHVQDFTIEETITVSTPLKDDASPSVQAGDIGVSDMAISTAPPTSATTLSTTPAPAMPLLGVSVASAPNPISPIAVASFPSDEVLEEELLNIEKKYLGTSPREEITAEIKSDVQFLKDSPVNEPSESQGVNVPSESIVEDDLILDKETSENLGTSCVESGSPLAAISKVDTVPERTVDGAPTSVDASQGSGASLEEADKSSPPRDAVSEAMTVPECVEGDSALLKKPSKNLRVNFGEVSESSPPPAEVSKAGAVPSKSSLKSQPKRPLSPSKKDEAPKAKQAKAPKAAKAAAIGVPSRNTKIGKVFIMDRVSEFQAVSNLTEDIVDICCGSHHTLALTASGELYSWGSNAGGALGRAGNEELPEKVEFDEIVEIVQIAAGGSISAVLTSSGKVYVTGDVELGQLGVRMLRSREDFEVSLELPTLSTAEDITSGPNHCLAYSTPSLYTWGSGNFNGSPKKVNEIQG